MSSFLGASVTKKVVMALAGLFLITFLVVHLGINLLLLMDDPAPFSTATHFMATNLVIKVFEVVLMGGFLVHILLGVVLQIQNWMARPIKYKVTANTQTSFFSKYMIYTGAIILIFLIIHFVNFYFVKLGLVKGDHENFYLIIFLEAFYLALSIFS